MTNPWEVADSDSGFRVPLVDLLSWWRQNPGVRVTDDGQCLHCNERIIPTLWEMGVRVCQKCIQK